MQDGSESIHNRALVFIGGDTPRPDALPALEPLVGDRGAGTIVVAVDSGLHTALALGVAVDHVVGDMDSVAPDRLASARRSGATTHEHPADKDATDLELALDLVLELLSEDTGGARPVEPGSDPHADTDARRSADAPTDVVSQGVHGGPDTTVGWPSVLVVGGGGGRLDHLLADILMLSAPRLSGMDVSARLGAASVSVVRPGRPVSIAGRPHEQVSLLPLHGDARGVTTEGLRWPLVDGHLVCGTSRGVSNEHVGGHATVSITDGVLVVVQPGTLAADVPDRPGPYDPTPAATATDGPRSTTVPREPDTREPHTNEPEERPR